jgi:hypothetical protein
LAPAALKTRLYSALPELTVAQNRAAVAFRKSLASNARYSLLVDGPIS